MNIYDQVKVLYDAGLYDDLKMTCGLVLTMSEHNTELLTVSQKYQITVFYGNSLFHQREYKLAEVAFRKALHLKKLINKTKGKGSQPLEVFPDVDVKYKLYRCYMHFKQYRDAISVLEGISSRQRTAKINKALGQLYQKTGNDRSAITCFKEVLRECPLSLEAVKGLLSLGVKASEAISLISAGTSALGSAEWLQSWIKGQAFISSREYGSAIACYSLLDAKSPLRDNVNILCNLGEAHLLNGDYNAAKLVLQRAHALEPLQLRKMDMLAGILAKDKEVKELENLSSHLIAVNDQAPEPWIALGFFCMATRKTTRAVYFAQKAFTLDNSNEQALLLKGHGLLELKRTQEAILHFREALKLTPYRYEVHKGLVESYVSCFRVREAITYAANALKQLGTSARSLTEQTTVEKAKTYLEKAMRLDPTYLEAVYVMADILSTQQQCDAGIALLRKQLRMQSTCNLHLMLGNFLTQTNEHQEALDQYSIALSLDPNNAQAKDGIEKVEKRCDMAMENTYDMEIEDLSENEDALDRSDVDSAWSDTDL
ncbi:anaphase-promoting complex subunit 7-like isoform X2 [Tubulanus polymorphus]|uniref:anaphase-promoting complex subunit 7-like isoform X2 n=1 Tax=Tubulanus polymorphus TaxID=672921 RepID=UPI003DA5B9D4